MRHLSFRPPKGNHLAAWHAAAGERTFRSDNLLGGSHSGRFVVAVKIAVDPRTSVADADPVMTELDSEIRNLTG